MMPIITRKIYRVTKPIAEDRIFLLPKGQSQYYLNMHDLLIQGANPTDPSVLSLQNNLQGGYICKLVITTPTDPYMAPSGGFVKVADDFQGFIYTPYNVGILLRDSFSYYVENIFGYASDSKCVFIGIGIDMGMGE